MKPKDRELGMDRDISRRDLLHGLGVLAAGALAPSRALADQVLALERGETAPFAYPPSLTGLRGNHIGSFEVAHQLAGGGRSSWGPLQQADSGVYDLVVVGGGISGLTAAHFYRNAHPKARILILDNHDDFGGHAKRNEFQSGGRTLIGYGGSQTLEAPGGYSSVAKGLLRELGVDTKRFDTAYDQEFYKRHGLGDGLYFDAEHWGVDKLVPFRLGLFDSYLALAPSRLSPNEAVAQMPISQPARSELLRLLASDQNCMPEFSKDAAWNYLSTTSYRDFLSERLSIREPEVFALLQNLATDSGVGIEATPASSALYYADLPGRKTTGIAEDWEVEPYIHHFPDGNASIARLLVRQLIPWVAVGKTMDDVVTARFDYSKLDEASSAVRLRLESTVVRVANEGDPKSAKRVRISYVRAGQPYSVQARSCVLACYNAMIPYLCPEIPEPQRKALALQVKTPILYTNVALKNWRAWKKLGIGAVAAPGSYHVISALDFPVSLPGYAFTEGPEHPIIVHMERFPHRSNEGLTPREQHRLGRHELLATSFDSIERQVRSQLGGMLAGGGFDPARDIDGITVNRWAHGYASWYNPLFDTVYEDDDDERYPHMLARKRFGRIAIANSDSAASAMLDAAVEQGYRAASELL